MRGLHLANSASLLAQLSVFITTSPAGAAWATLAAQVAGVMIFFATLRRKNRPRDGIRLVWRGFPQLSVLRPFLSVASTLVSRTIFTMVALSAFESLAVIAALPEIASELGDVDLLAWIVTAYLVAATLSSVAAGAFIDSIGVRRIFLIGVSVFGVATVLGG